MSATGFIFSNLHDKNISALTARRTMASVPFGCRYRLVDFALSNMVNAGITDVNVITHYNYHSLMDHVGSGKDWDLARRSGGLKILPPFVTAFEGGAAAKVYETRLEALLSVIGVIEKCTDDYLVFSDCDSICNIDVEDMLKKHVESGAGITFAVKRMAVSDKDADTLTTVKTDGDTLVEMHKHSKASDEEQDVLINIWVATRTYLLQILKDAQAKNLVSFHRDVLPGIAPVGELKVYRFDGFYANITSMEQYFSCNMGLLNREIRDDLFKVPNRPILTKVRNSAPTKYIEGCEVKNSMIADGCVIEGKVENSILFRGVHVSKGAVVTNSILFQDDLICENASVNCVIGDKNVTIRTGVHLSGHQTMPLFVEKEKTI